MSNDLIRFEPVQRLRFLSFFRITSSLFITLPRALNPAHPILHVRVTSLDTKSNKVRYNAARSVMVSSSDVKAWWSRSKWNLPKKGGGMRSSRSELARVEPATRQHSSWTCTGEGPTLRRAPSRRRPAERRPAARLCTRFPPSPIEPTSNTTAGSLVSTLEGGHNQ